jgi:hypothetical protein
MEQPPIWIHRAFHLTTLSLPRERRGGNEAGSANAMNDGEKNPLGGLPASSTHHAHHKQSVLARRVHFTDWS